MILLNFIGFSEFVLMNAIAILVMPAKLATPNLFKKCILKKSSDTKISKVVNCKILSHEPN